MPIVHRYGPLSCSYVCYYRHIMSPYYRYLTSIILASFFSSTLFTMPSHHLLELLRMS